MALWGIDLGGTKIEGIILNNKSEARVLLRKRMDTEAHRGYEHIIRRIKLLIARMGDETGLKPEKMGIGTPGTLDPVTQQLKNSNTTCLNGRYFKYDLQKAVGLPFEMANDANCFALAETKLGAVRQKLPDARVVFGVIMGTGVGGGIVVNGQVLAGRQGITGEWGHNFLDESGGECYCGKTGCVEKVISGKNLERYFEKRTGRTETLKSIYQAHLNGNDPDATMLVERLMCFFGKALANVINILDPDAVVLGGGVGNIDLLYTRGMAEVKKHVFNRQLDTVFLKPKLGDSAGVFGAAYLAG